MLIFSSIGQKVWPTEIPQCLVQKLKHHSVSELGALEAEFGLFPWANRTRVGYAWMRNLILPNLKKVSQSEFICKSYDRFTEARPGYSSGRCNMTQNQNQVRQKHTVCDGKG
jgi:hypothetical protein